MKTRNSPIKSDDTAAMTMTQKPPPALSLNDTVAAEAEALPSTKRRKVEENDSEQTDDKNDNNDKSAASDNNMETIDVATILGLKPGDRIEVKWSINEEDDEEPAPKEGERMGLPKTEGEEDGDNTAEPLPKSNHASSDNDVKKEKSEEDNNLSSNRSSPAPPGMITVWWKATVKNVTGGYHILDDAEEAERAAGAASPLKALLPATTNAASLDNQTYNCPKCSKENMSKQGLATHYGMVHGGKIARDYPHLLSQDQTSNGGEKTLPAARVPIYEIVYDPLPSLGFPDYYSEEVAFISNALVLNLSSDEMMNYRKEGDITSPAAESDSDGRAMIGDVSMEDVGGGLAGIFGNEAATTSAMNTAATNPNDICKEFRSEDDIRTYMNELMQKSMMSTGMNTKMASLPRSQQNVIAGRINKALEGLLGKMMEEMGRMEGGSRVVTADVVRRCMEQMRGF